MSEENIQEALAKATRERDELKKELEESRYWKQEAMNAWPDMQAIGKALNIRLGESVHDKILPGIERLKGLIKDALFFMEGHPRDGYLWNNFKSANNL